MSDALPYACDVLSFQQPLLPRDEVTWPRLVVVPNGEKLVKPLYGQNGAGRTMEWSHASLTILCSTELPGSGHRAFVSMGAGIITHIALSLRELMDAKRDNLVFIKRRVARILVYGLDEIGEIIVNPGLAGATVHVMSSDCYKPAVLSAAGAWLTFMASRIGTERPAKTAMLFEQQFAWFDQGIVSDYFDELVLVNDLNWSDPDPESFFPGVTAFRTCEPDMRE